MLNRRQIAHVRESDWQGADPRTSYKIVSVDPTAAGPTPGKSWAVYQLWGVVQARARWEAWILDELRTQAPAHLQSALIRGRVRAWVLGCRLPGPVRRVVFEQSAAGPALATTLAYDLRQMRLAWEAPGVVDTLRQVPELVDLATFPEVSLRATGGLGKELRSRLAWPYFERSIARVADFPGADATIDELAAGGAGVSDRHDAAVQALLDLEERGAISLGVGHV